MGSFWPHVFVIVDSSKECTHLLECLWALELEDSINLLSPGLQSRRSEPVSQPISLLDAPLTFEGVDSATIVL